MNILRNSGNRLFNLIESFFIVFALMRLFTLHTTDFTSFILFLLIYFSISQNRHHFAKGMNTHIDEKAAALLSFLFTLFTILAKYNTILGNLSSKLFCLIILLGTTVGLLFFYYFVTRAFIYLGSMLTVTSDTFSSQKLPVITFFACMIGWLPYLLYNYPGVMTPDSINQYAQIIGVYAKSNHHPWMHTLLIQLWYRLGLHITNNAIIAISFYTVFQMCFLALTASFVTFTLQTVRVKNSISYFVIAFYALMPYNGAFSVTIWKDVMFAAAFTLFSCTMIHFLIINRTLPKSLSLPWLCTLYVISGFMVCLFRTNGWYVFLVTLPFLIYTLREHFKLIIPLNIGLFILVLFVKVPLMNIYDVIQPDFAESLSIPAQQIARVYAMNPTISAEQDAMLRKIIDTSRLAEVYQPDVYDNVKYLLREGDQNYLASHKADYFKLWLSIGASHPKEYIDAFVAQTWGYWYPDVPCEIGLDEGIYANDFSLKWTPILKGSLFIKIKEIIFKLPSMIPLYGLLWSMGSIFWMLLLLIACTIKRENTPYLILFVPPVALVATLCLATPVAAEFRYVYSIFYTIPLYITIPFLPKR